MGRVSEVVSHKDGSTRHDDGASGASTAEHFGAPGDDAPPLPGDDVLVVEGEGAGEEHAAGYADATTKKAANGERRIYSRTPAGELAAEFWLKGDGSVVVTNLLAPAGGAIELKADGSVVLNGVEISPTGSITVPTGETLGNPVLDVLTHIHQVAAAPGPTGPPTPAGP